MTLAGAPADLSCGDATTITAHVEGSSTASVLWTVDNVPNGNADLGTITGSGSTVTYTAPSSEGSHTLAATSLADTTKSASAQVRIHRYSTISSVSLNPTTWTLGVGNQEQFTATVTGTGNYNNGVTWSAQRGTVTSTGLYTAPATGGSDVVTAKSVQNTNMSATASITVAVPAGITSVSVSPATPTFNVNGLAQFTATVTGTGSYSSTVTWTAQRGTITSSGLYTAPATGGSDTVTATSTQDTSKSGSTSVTVLAPATITSVSVSPATPTFNVNGLAQFTATVTGTGSYSSTVTWTAQRGTITSSGLYTAPATGGSDVVTATSTQNTSKFGSASVTVLAPATITSVSVSPATPTFNVNGLAQFTATVTGTGSYSSTVTWTAQRGSITSSGLYTAPATGGSDTVTATSTQDTSKSGSTSVTVLAPATITSVSVSPATPTFNVNGLAQFTAAVTGTGSYSSAVTWTAQRGTVTSTGLYTAPATGGSDVVTAKSTQDVSKLGTASITVVTSATITAVAVSPATSTLNVGAQSQFSATVTGTGSYSSGVTWTAQRGTVTSTGLYTAPATGGSDVVTAKSTQDASKLGTASITVVAPISITSVSVNPATLALNVSTQNQFTATVAGTGSYSAGVTWTAQRGTITSAGLYTAPATSGTDVVTATSTADASKSGSSALTVLDAQTVTGIIVAPNGVLGNPGTPAAPTTLEGAQTIIRNAISAGSSNLQVVLRGGLYLRSASLNLGATDSGTAAKPVSWVAYPNEVPRLAGGTTLSPASFKLVDSTDPNWSRLDTTARGKIYVADLTAYKTNLGNLTSRTDASVQLNQAMELFVDGQPLALARYPKAVDAASVNLAPQATIRVSGTITPDATGDYTYKGLDSKGHPYYQLAKNGEIWSIAVSATGPGWYLSNRSDLGGHGTPTTTWGDWESFAGPAGKFSPSGGSASGTPFLDPADGSPAMPGFLIIRSTNGSTQIQAPDSHMSRWRASEAMYFGFGYYCWSGIHEALTSVDSTTGTIQLSTTPNYGLRTGQPFFLYNLLEELTDPGEYFIDRVNARIYMRPVGDVPPSEVLISLLQTPLVQMTSAKYITWQGVAFEAGRDRLVVAQSCQNVSFKSCQFRNAGGYGLLLNGSTNLVDACDFRQLGQGGIWVSGGDRASVTPSGTVIQNSEFQRFGRLFWTYQPAIFVHSIGDWSFNGDCIGITVQNNEIHHSPHAGLIFSGSGNTIQYNLIHDVTQWASDAGALYTTGREWGTQGNLIKSNLLRNCGQSPFGWSLSGIYIDGSGSGVTIEGNILYHSSPWVAEIHNGGRDVITRYNVFYGHLYGMDLVNFGSLANNTAGSSWNLLEKLKHFNYQTAPWSTSYPNVAAIPNDWTLLQGTHWLEPENSVLYGNLQFGLSGDVYRQGSTMKSLADPITWFTQVGSNLSQVDPMFTDPANLDFSLKPASPMYAIPGFPGIDTTRIGIQR